jgi:hypothetical protein
LRSLRGCLRRGRALRECKLRIQRGHLGAPERRKDGGVAAPLVTMTQLNPLAPVVVDDANLYILGGTGASIFRMPKDGSSPLFEVVTRVESDLLLDGGPALYFVSNESYGGHISALDKGSWRTRSLSFAVDGRLLDVDAGFVYYRQFQDPEFNRVSRCGGLKKSYSGIYALTAFDDDFIYTKAGSTLLRIAK